MKISLNPDHLKRYAAIGWLLIKHGRSDWVQQMGLDEAVRASQNGFSSAERGKAEELADDLEKMGPTFVKLGQLLSSRADLLPPVYLEALSRLQDDVEPFSFDEVERTIQRELGVRISRAFSDFEPRPLAAASLGQVHLARLRDGRPVAVKIQRPGIRERISLDFDALEYVADFLDEHTEFGRSHSFQRHLVELRKSLLNELDYRLEAGNLKRIAQNLKDFENIVVPRPIEDYCAPAVLTMEHIRGAKITELSPVVLLEVDGPRLTRDLFNAYLKQILLDGFFHADPHPGNILITDDHRIALLDLGMVAMLTPEVQQGSLKLLLAISEGRGEDAADEAIAIGEPTQNFDRGAFRRRVADFVAGKIGARVEDLQAGRIVLEIQRISAESGFRLPQVFTMIGKMLLNLDRIGRVLDPQFDPNQAIRENALDLMRQRMRKNISLGNVLQSALETTDFIQRLPQRLNAVMDAVTNKEMSLHVDAIDEEHLLKGLHKIANRITVGLVIAALIIGAALLMRVDTSFRILGYPGLAMILFALAALGGIILVVRIWTGDHRDERQVSRKSTSKKS